MGANKVKTNKIQAIKQKIKTVIKLIELLSVSRKNKINCNTGIRIEFAENTIPASMAPRDEIIRFSE